MLSLGKLNPDLLKQFQILISGFMSQILIYVSVIYDLNILLAVT